MDSSRLRKLQTHKEWGIIFFGICADIKKDGFSLIKRFRRNNILRKQVGRTYRKYKRKSALMAILPCVWNIQTMNSRTVRHGMAKLCKASGCMPRIRIGFTRKVRTCRLGKLVFKTVCRKTGTLKTESNVS